MDCSTNKTIGWITGNRDAKTFEKLYKKIEKTQAIIYTDNWDVYRQIIPEERHIVGKKYTVTIEQNNSNIRHHLGRMTRKTKVVSKSEKMIDLTLKLWWYINELGNFYLFQKQFLCIFS